MDATRHSFAPAPEASRTALDEALQALLAPDVAAPLDELTSVLQSAAVTVARLRRQFDPCNPQATALLAVDESFSRSITLTRELRTRFQASQCRGDYASVSHVAREVVGRLQHVLPDGISLSVDCPGGPAVVAAARAELYRLVVELVGVALEAVGTRGAVAVEVWGTTARVDAIVAIELRCTAALDPKSEPFAISICPRAHSLGGTVAFRELGCGGSLVSVSFPSALR